MCVKVLAIARHIFVNIISLLLLAYGKKAGSNTIAYKTIRHTFHKFMKGGRLLFVKLDLTERCNGNCEYCYSERRDIEPSLGEIEKFFSQLKGRLCGIDLMGGEPMLREDINEIIKAAKKIGKIFRVRMFTNGTLIGRKSAINLKKNGLGVAFVSFYSNVASLQDSISGYDGTFEKKITAIKELVRAGIKTYTFTVLNKKNVNQITSIRTLIRELGASPVFSNQIPINNEISSIQLTPKEVYGVKESLGKNSKAHMTMVNNMFEFAERVCFGGYYLLSIKVDGAVTHCPFIYDIALGNAFKEDIFEIFKRRFSVKAFRDAYGIPAECLPCVFVKYCKGGCRAGNADYSKKSFSCQGPWQDVEFGKMSYCISHWF
ncbi:MAG: radical SAM protein [Candidatus Omnitrophota bacterium]|jgi:radical SAM protein with 4Fe4S-binding SPASM domain